jgi:hypothetical protein
MLMQVVVYNSAAGSNMQHPLGGCRVLQLGLMVAVRGGHDEGRTVKNGSVASGREAGCPRVLLMCEVHRLMCSTHLARQADPCTGAQGPEAHLGEVNGYNEV